MPVSLRLPKPPKRSGSCDRRGILTVGIPQTVEPLSSSPTPQDVREMLNQSGLNRQRTPQQVHIACACGYSSPK